MGDITTNFSIREFDSGDGVEYPRIWVATRLLPLVTALQIVRFSAGDQPLLINSGFRSYEWNESVSGEPDSRHMYGMAADIRSRYLNALDLYALIEKLISQGAIPDGGLGKYSGHVHYDQRGHTARW